MAKTSAHIRYRNRDNEIVPGATTVLGILNKPALVPWANKLGLSGIDVNKFVDDKAEIGTLAHAMVEAYLKGEQADTSDYSKNQIEQAENSLLSFFEWSKDKVLEPILLEAPLVSETYQYGGTVDCYCKLDGVLTLLDFKTSKAIYPEMMYQLGAYQLLLYENGHKVDQCRILRIGRDADEGFEERTKNLLGAEQAIFLNCLAIYNLQKGLKKEATN